MSVIEQSVLLPAPPARVYEVLTSGADFTTAAGGRAATIDASEGGTFSLFGGMIYGRNIELVAGTRVVQAWRVKLWDPGTYSVASFALAPEGAGTRVTLRHAGFPEGQADHLAAGWHANYWEPLAKYLG
jgi:activator of HSP90 ATPase